MANNAKIRSHIKDFLLKMKAMDEAVPEDLAEDALEMVNGVNDAMNEEEQTCDEDADVLEVTKDEEGNLEKKIEDTMVKVLMKNGLIKDSSMSALDAAENELAEDEEHTEPDGDEEGGPGDDDGDEPTSSNDSAVQIRKAIRAMKPIVASIKDNKQRKIMSDNLAALIRSTGSTTTSNDQYSKILDVTKKNQKAMDKKAKAEDANPEDFGHDIARRFNPHYMKEEK